MNRQIKPILIGGTLGLAIGAVLLLLIGMLASSSPPRVASGAVSAPVEVSITPAGASVNLPPSQPPTVAPTLEARYHTVVAGDTIWSIAVQYDVPLEAIVAANAGVSPDALQPGDVLLIPDPGSLPPLTPTPTDSGADDTVTGTVATDGSSLRLRSEPIVLNNIIALLNPGTRLTIVGRTGDDRWFQVFTSAGETGWVMSEWVVVAGDLESVAVTGEGVAIPAALPGTPQALTELSEDYPYIANITPSARAIFERGQALGNRADVFSKVGDSITDNGIFLEPFGRGDYNLREYDELQPVVTYFSQAVARDSNSFANTSLAAKGGWSAWHLSDPDSADEELCLPGETPLECEYRLVRPSVALIMLGTNDIPTAPPAVYEGWMRQIIETSLDRGVIPVLSTIPAFHNEEEPQEYEGRVAVFNGIIAGLALEYDIPLWDYWAAMQYLPNEGLSGDGIHPSWAVPADFTPEYLQYGMPVRNLTALQALDAVWRQVLS